MVLAKREETRDGLQGAAVYTEAGQLAGFVFEEDRRCVGISLCGGVTVWLGKSMIRAVEGRSVFLVGDLLRKQGSLHMSIHLHPNGRPAADSSAPEQPAANVSDVESQDLSALTFTER